MKWKSKNFEINAIYKDGAENRRFAYGGEVSWFFGWHHEDGIVLTHLKTGYKIEEFRDVESAKRVGDYLTEKYSDELTALNTDFRKSMTWQEYKALPSAKILNEKIKQDKIFGAMVEELKYVERDLCQ